LTNVAPAETLNDVNQSSSVILHVPVVQLKLFGPLPSHFSHAGVMSVWVWAGMHKPHPATITAIADCHIFPRVILVLHACLLFQGGDLAFSFDSPKFQQWSTREWRVLSVSITES